MTNDATSDEPEKAAPGAEPAGDALADLEPCCLVGQTASGKSALALEVAERADAEIVSLDSMLVYRRMDIGTAKPTLSERECVPHHMLDLVDPPEAYDVQRYLTDLRALLRERRGSERRLLFVGGTAFYLKALVHGLFDGPPADRELRERIKERLSVEGNERLHAELTRVDPRAAERIHPNDAKRLVRALEVFEQTGRPLSEWQREWGWHDGGAAARRRGAGARLVGLDVPTDELDARIARRTTAMLDAGWADEARAIRDGVGFGPTSIQALGYAQVLDYADGRISRGECDELVRTRTRQFARRQRTWYRKFDEIEWLHVSDGRVSEQHVVAALRHLGWTD